MDALVGKVAEGSARVAVIGLGYVGLPLAVGFAKIGFPVLGLDVDECKLAALAEGTSYIQDVDTADVASVIKSGLFTPTNDYDQLRDVDAMIICVPTPFDAMKAPDLAFVKDVAQEIVSRLRAGQLVILQSTTYPGTTEEFVLPILEASGLRAGKDFHLAFSPERINPGDTQVTVEHTPKVVGGLTSQCTELAR